MQWGKVEKWWVGLRDFGENGRQQVGLGRISYVAGSKPKRGAKCEWFSRIELIIALRTDWKLLEPIYWVTWFTICQFKTMFTVELDFQCLRWRLTHVLSLLNTKNKRTCLTWYTSVTDAIGFFAWWWRVTLIKLTLNADWTISISRHLFNISKLHWFI